MTTMCIRHQDKPAVTKCKCCNKPICQDCIIQTEFGSFCSEICKHKIKQHLERVADIERKEKLFMQGERKRKQALLIKNFVTLGILIFVFIVIWNIIGHSGRKSVMSLIYELIRFLK